MFQNYLKTMVRAIRRSTTYSFLNIAGLGLGIACATLIFIWVEDEFSYDHAYVKHNEIYSIRMNIDYGGKVESFTSIPGPMPEAIGKQVAGVLHYSRLGFGRELFGQDDKRSYERGLYVDSGFFSMMQLPFVRGNASGFGNPHTLVLSEGMARKFFGDADPVGKTLQLNNQQAYTVLGVVKDQPPNVSLRFGWLAPVKNFLDQNAWLNSWSTYGINTMVELAPGANVQAINHQLTAVLQPKDQLYAHASCVLWAMNDWHLYGNFVNGKQDGGLISQVRLFSSIAWVILIIACINFMNLATARAGQRAREIGVRKTLGALRKALIGQFLVETLAMALISTLLAVVLVYLFLPGFNVLIQKDMHFNLLAPAHWLGLLAIGVFCGLVAGSYPAFYLSAFRPVDVLKGQRVHPSSGTNFIRKGLVVTQFTVSVVLIVSTVVIYQQIQHIKERDLGYKKEHLLFTAMPQGLAEHFKAYRADLLRAGAVEDAALSGSPALQMWGTVSSTKLNWEGSDPQNNVKIVWESASPEYIHTLGLSLVAGRNFHTDIHSDSGNVIINESMAAIMGKAGRIGGMFTYHGDAKSMHVIGIVKNYLYNNVYGSVGPVILTCDPENSSNYPFLTIRLRGGKDLAANLAKVEAVTKNYAPGYPTDFQFVDQVFDQLFESEAELGRLAAVFAMLAVVISCLGLFGLAAYTAERRTKEIGIRKVLGASTVGLAGLLSGEFVKLVGLSCLVAFPLAWWAMDRFLSDYAYRTTIHWWVFGLTGVAAIGIALVTVSFQAVRAATANPVKTLKCD